MTYTYAILEISKAAYDEIKNKLEVAGYSDQFHKNDGQIVINMHGIALAQEKENAISQIESTKNEVGTNVKGSSIRLGICCLCGATDGHETWCPTTYKPRMGGA